MKVTVLMPVYNAETYLHDSIESLLAQTSNAWELICIDDGSTDNSKKIIENYCKQNPQIKLLYQTNAGPAMARARAIQIINTEYVAILDADDAYPPEYIELMLKRAEETHADIIVPDVRFEYNHIQQLPNMFIQHHLNPNMIIENGEEAFAMTFPWKLHGWQMIRTSLAQKYYTIENGAYSKFNSDEYITRLLYLKSKKTALCKAEYCYRISENSITRTNSLKKIDYLKTLDKLLVLSIQEKISNKIILDIYNEYYTTIIDLIKMTQKLPLDEARTGLAIIKEYYKNSYRKKFQIVYLHDATLKTKIKIYISLISFYFFQLIVLLK